jgi:putative inorganic carbon (HCO3(-)) transporter
MDTELEARTEVVAQRRRVLIGCVIVIVAAVFAGFGAERSDRAAFLIPVVAAGGVGLVYLAISRFEYFVLAILLARASLDAAKIGAGSIDATGALSVLFVAAAAFWLLAQRRDPAAETSATAPLMPPLVALVAAAALGLLISRDPLESAVEWVRLGTLVAIVAVLGRILKDERMLKLGLLAVLGSAVVPVMVATLQSVRGGGLVNTEGLDRIRGTFAHSNPFASYLFLMITLAVAIFPHVSRRWRIALIPYVLACGGLLILTYTRGAWVALIAALIVIAILQDRRIFLFLLAAAVALAILVPSVGVRLSDLSQEEKATGAPGNSLVWRFSHWREVLALQTNPLVGIGLKEVELRDVSQVPPHNDLVRVYVEMGLAGLAAYLWLAAALWVESWRTWKRAPTGLPRGLAVGALAATAGVAMLSLVANVITQLVILWYYFAIVALAMAASSRVRDEAPVAA